MTVKTKTPSGELTKRQKDVYDRIVTFCEHYGYSPTIRELCTSMRVKSPNAVFLHLKKLKDKGYVTWQPMQNRTIRPVGGLK
jgi:repressor LexA